METMTAMEELIVEISTFINQAFAWLGSVIDAITGNPILLIFVVCVPLVGLAIGLFNRLIRSN